MVYSAAEKDQLGTGEPLPVVTRPREPMPSAQSPEGKRWRQAQAAAQTLAEKEEKLAKEEKRPVRPTPTARDLFDGVKPKDGPPPEGETINGVYIPTIEEITRAGYTNPEGIREKAIADAKAAGPKTGEESAPPPAAPPTEPPPNAQP